MSSLSLRKIAQNCLGRDPPISLLRDIFSIYGNDHPQNRSLLNQLALIQNKPFVRIALVTIQNINPAPNIQRDLDNANEIYQRECDAWIYCTGSITINRPDLLILDQNDCSATGHIVSNEENDLFSLGRNLGANIVCYYIQDGPGDWVGCAAHPPGMRGFWVGSNPNIYTFPHELTHIVGDNAHTCDKENLMLGGVCNKIKVGTNNIINLPPDLTQNQINRILNDTDMGHC